MHNLPVVLCAFHFLSTVEGGKTRSWHKIISMSVMLVAHDNITGDNVECVTMTNVTFCFCHTQTPFQSYLIAEIGFNVLRK